MRVRFLADSRNSDWRKNDLGTVEKVLAKPPQSQNTIMIVRLEDGNRVWATDRDVVEDGQMTIFDILPTDDTA